MKTSIASKYVERDHDRNHDFLKAVQRRFNSRTKSGAPLFTTNVEGLWDLYLKHAPAAERQNRNCNACRRFIETYGGLATADMEPVIWPTEAPPMYADACEAIRKAFKKAEITGVFKSKELIWGQPKTGPWTHISIKPSAAYVSTSPLKTASQEMAEKLEEFRMLQRGLQDFSLDSVRKAHAMLSNGQLYRSEKCVGVAKWLLDLHVELLDCSKNKRLRNSTIWFHVATAPAGYCHVRSGMIGTLLEDIEAGLPFEALKNRFNEKMNPLQYMRPTAPPTAGNVAQAEKIVETLRSAGALDRRFARLADVETLWLPAPPPPPVRTKASLFSHLMPVAPKVPVDAGTPPVVMTWDKFQRTVLPTAENIEFYLPFGKNNFTATVTAVNPDAPNLLQWDNPCSHYVYNGGSNPQDWNLTPNSWQRVSAVSLRPWMWKNPERFNHHGRGVVFVLENCRDLKYQHSGGLFPEQMSNEYHSVRKTLEAFYKTYSIKDKERAGACGIVLEGSAPKSWDAKLAVTANGVRSVYVLDRWD